MNNKEFSAKLLANFDISNLIEKVSFFKKELFNLRFQKTLGELKNVNRFSEVKKSIAQLKTEISKRINKGN